MFQMGIFLLNVLPDVSNLLSDKKLHLDTQTPFYQLSQMDIYARQISKKHTQICTKDVQIFYLFFVHICLIIVRVYLLVSFACSPVIRAHLPIVRAYLHTCICPFEYFHTFLFFVHISI